MLYLATSSVSCFTHTILLLITRHLIANSQPLFPQMLLWHVRPLAEMEKALLTFTNWTPGEYGFFQAIRTALEMVLYSYLHVMKRLQDTYGSPKLEPIPFRLLWKRAIFLQNPEHNKLAFTDHHFTKFPVEHRRRRFRDILGLSLVTVEPEMWAAMRKRTIPMLTGQRLRHYGTIMDDMIKKVLLPRWTKAAEIGTPVDIWTDMLAFSSRVVFMAFMGLPENKIPDHIHPTLNRIFGHVRERIVRVFTIPLWFPTPRNLSYRRDMNVMRKFISDYIDETVGSKENPNSIDGQTFINSIILAHTDASGHLNREFAIQESISNLIGGSETTIVLMSWAIYHLSHNLDVQDTLRLSLKQPDSGVGVHTPGDEISATKRTYMRCVMDETLRMTPPAAAFHKNIQEDIQLGSITATKGMGVFGSQVLTHNNPFLWKDAKQFNPSRFLEGKPQPGSFFPFADGMRLCPGSGYAYLEAEKALSALISNFHVTPGPGCSLTDEMPLDVDLTMRPGKNVLVYLKKIEVDAN